VPAIGACLAETVSGNMIKSFGLASIKLQLKLPNETAFRGSRRDPTQRKRIEADGTPPESRSQRRLI
jgi:hypothetical protein